MFRNHTSTGEDKYGGCNTGSTTPSAAVLWWPVADHHHHRRANSSAQTWVKAETRKRPSIKNACVRSLRWHSVDWKPTRSQSVFAVVSPSRQVAFHGRLYAHTQGSRNPRVGRAQPPRPAPYNKRRLTTPFFPQPQQTSAAMVFHSNEYCTYKAHSVFYR